jgi:NADPH-dependent 2,4-dienoyl-CoA reductase/sulfur reductase-like enzyme
MFVGGETPGAHMSNGVKPPTAPVRAVRLTGNTIVEADVVLVAIGCRPCVEWLEGSGLRIDDGVVCDEYCVAAPGVWAAGDVARWHHPVLGRELRLEHRMNANEQAQAVADNILGSNTPFAPVPFFWTDHYNVKIQVWGTVPADAHATLVEGDLDSDSFVMAFRGAGSHLVEGYLGWNAGARMAAYRDMLAAEGAYSANKP